MTERIGNAPAPSRRLAALLCAAAVLASGLLSAQSAPSAPTGVSQAADGNAGLPIRRVVLYKTGVGYFEHLGSVRDNQTVTVDFTSVQLDDVLRGMMLFSQEQHQRQTYTLRNENADARVLVIEHPAREGWRLRETMTPTETTSRWHRFRIGIEPKTTATFTVEEAHPIHGQIAISELTPERVEPLVRERVIDASLAAELRPVLAQKAELARLEGEMAGFDQELEQIDQDQSRLRENMRALKGSSAERQLLQRYVRQLDEQETRLADLRVARGQLATDRDRAQEDLAALIEWLAR